jgi:hypothetical protein
VAAVVATNVEPRRACQLKCGRIAFAWEARRGEHSDAVAGPKQITATAFQARRLATMVLLAGVLSRGRHQVSCTCVLCRRWTA